MSGGTQTLYIFPHAGGSADFYVPFASAFPKDIRRIAVQYPGRRGTHDLASFASIHDLAESAQRMVSPSISAGGHVALFGHSMGALVAFEVARRLESDGISVRALFVSACAAPGRIGYEYIPESDRGLLDAVAEMTGASSELLEDEEFAAKILPTLRGLKAISAYECSPDATVSCPIYAYFGDDDEVATYDKVRAWSDRTMSEFAAREFSGHHFYLNDHLAEVAVDIQEKLRAVRIGD
jgi:surfactin synthase thioesterase subunit